MAQVFRIPGTITIKAASADGLIKIEGLLHGRETWAVKCPNGQVTGDAELFRFAEKLRRAAVAIRSGQTRASKDLSVSTYDGGIYVRGPRPDGGRADARIEVDGNGAVVFSGYKELLFAAAQPHTLDDAVTEVAMPDGMPLKSTEESSSMELLKAVVHTDRPEPENPVGDIVSAILADPKSSCTDILAALQARQPAA